jgi:hypothetical protein
MQTLDVVFRAERSGLHKGEVTAVFPTIWEGMNTYQCYAYVGQHSGCARDWYYTTRPATPDEYGDLLAELKAIYETPPAAWACEPVKLRVKRRANWA